MFASINRSDRSILIHLCLFIWIMHVASPPVAAQGISRRVHVTLHVFSGRRDPEWDVIDTDNRIVDLVNSAGAGGVLPSILGYKGFTATVMLGGQMVKTVTVPSGTNRPLELALLNSAPPNIPTEFRERLRGAINAQPPVASQGMGRRVHVTLHVFSGRRDPEWDVIDTNNRIVDLVNSAGAGGVLPSILGYKGFTVRMMLGGQMVKSVTVPSRTNRPLELALLNSAPPTIPTEFRERLRGAINAQV